MAPSVAEYWKGPIYSLIQNDFRLHFNSLSELNSSGYNLGVDYYQLWQLSLNASYESFSLPQWQRAAAEKCSINEKKNLKNEDVTLHYWNHILCSGMKILELHKNILFFGKLIMLAKFFFNSNH